MRRIGSRRPRARAANTKTGVGEVVRSERSSEAAFRLHLFLCQVRKTTNTSEGPNPAKFSCFLSSSPTAKLEKNRETGGSGRAATQSGGDGASASAREEQATTHRAGASRIKWKPNERCLEMLLTMGIDKNTAIKGLYYTGNCSADYAASFIFDHPDLDDDLDFQMRFVIEDTKSEHEQGEGALDSDDESGEVQRYKMVFVVNSSLGMSSGKIAAEVAHASVGLYRRLNNGGKRPAEQLAAWEEDGERMIVLSGEDASHLMQLDKQALSVDLETYIVRDTEGMEVAQDAITVVGIFGREDTVNSVTGRLPKL